MKSKIIYLLIGQKGSGKSFIGTLIEKEFGIKFIRVEDWAKQIKKDRLIENEVYLKQVFDEIEKGIREFLKETNKIVFESTGLTVHFDRMYQNLKKDFLVITIGINADSTICLERVKSRDQTIHIDVSDDQVKIINEKIRNKDFKTDFVIDNHNKTRKALIKELDYILKNINSNFHF